MLKVLYRVYSAAKISIFWKLHTNRRQNCILMPYLFFCRLMLAWVYP